MHDLDRTISEFEPEMEYEGEYELESEYEFENEYEFEFESEGVLTDEEEMELAAELLEVGSDEELEYFFKKMFKRVKRFARSKTGRALGGIFKGIVKKALPVVGGAIGSFVAPGAGTAIGSRLGSMVSGALEMELEGIGQEDMEFETARRLVRIASTAAKNAARIPPGSMNSGSIAQQAIKAAIKRHIPNASHTAGSSGRGKRGTWVRRGRQIILHNV